MRVPTAVCIGCLAVVALAAPAALAQENYESWPVLRSTFPSTGGDGIMIKGYDPVITSAANPKFASIIAASPIANFGFKAALES